ncbi:MAG: DNA polymerase III subunit beta [Clostridia bacterium]|nr:DNA polymerase III subunit beta [Clostridia bacterium]
MKFTCNRDMLAEGLSIVQKAIPSKSNYPALECVLIDVSEDLILTGSDTDLSITYQVPVMIIEEIGTALVNARVFYDIVRRLPDIYVTIETQEKGGNLIVNSGKAHFEVPTINPDQYPKISFLSNTEDNVLELPAATLGNMIKQTAFAASQDSARMILRGVLIENSGGLLKFVAIDGYRLAVKTSQSAYQEEFRIVVPAKVLSEMAKIIEKSDKNIKFCFSESQVMFFNDSFSLVSGLLKGEFPDYNMLLPKEYKCVMSVKNQTFVDTIERVSLVIVDDKKWFVDLTTYPDQVFICANGENGKSHETVPADISGQEVLISFNVKNLIECLKAIEKENITINFSSEKGPCVINSDEDSSYFILLMPVKHKSR